MDAAQATAAAAPPPLAEVPANPYPGLRAFARSEAALFFGRRQQIEALAGRLEAGARFVAVAGASGCGKSSLVLAGVLPALLQRTQADGSPAWRALEMRPGNRPIANLAAAMAAHLRDGADDLTAPALEGRLRLSAVGLDEAVRASGLPEGTRVLVVVDQFEELFRFRSMADPQESAAFVKLLLHAAAVPGGAVTVVVTLRSDMLGYCADYEGLPEAISDGQYLVPRLSREQRREAIVGPARLRGRDVAPSLVQRLLNDVSSSYDDLPVMQHVLTRTWRAWVAAGAPDRPLDLNDYRATGGALHALSRHADEIVAELAAADPALARTAERVFRAITERIVDGTEVRRSLPWDRLVAVCGGDAVPVERVVDRFRRADAALLLPPAQVPLAGNPPIDISHESLIRGWAALRGWAEQEAESARIYRRIAASARLHDEKQEALMQDPGLQIALDWRATHAPNAAWAQLYGGGFDAAMRYLDESLRVRDENARAEREAQASRKRWRRILRWSAVAVGGVMTVMAITNTLALHRLRAAEAEKDEARRRNEEARVLAQAVAESAQLSQLANAERLEGRFDLALLYGAAAVRVNASSGSLDVLRRLLLAAPARLLETPGDPAMVAFSPDGRRLLGVTDAGSLLVWDARTGRQEGSLVAAQDQGERIAAFDAAGGVVATPSSDAEAVIWPDVAAAKQRPPGTPAEARTATALDAERRRMAFTLFEGGPVTVWDLAASRPLFTLAAGDAPAVALTFSPDGNRLAMADNDGRVLLWDLSRGQQAAARLLRTRGASVSALRFSPDGRWLAAADLGGGLGLWELRPGAAEPRPRALAGHEQRVMTVAFDPAGTVLASAAADGSVRLWSTRDGRRIGGGASPHRGAVQALAFSADGRLLASGGSDPFVQIWNAANGQPSQRRLRAHRKEVVALAFSPREPRLASAARDGVVALWDLAPGQSRLGSYLGDEGSAVTTVAVSPDGAWMVAGRESGRVEVWNMAEPGERPAELRVHTGRITAAAFAPVAGFLVTAGDDGLVVRSDPARRSTRTVSTGEGDAAPPVAAVFAGGDRWLVTAAEDGRLSRHDLENPGSVQHSEPGEAEDIVALAASADGRHLASAARRGRVRLWDAQTLRPLHQFTDAEGQPTALAFTPDGRTLVAAFADGQLASWNADERRPLRRFGTPGLGVRRIAMAPDGQTVAAGDVGGYVTFWSLADGRARQPRLPIYRGNVSALAYAPDGRTIVSAAATAPGLLVWDGAPGSWAGQACAIAGRDLAEGERPPHLAEAVRRAGVCPQKP